MTPKSTVSGASGKNQLPKAALVSLTLGKVKSRTQHACSCGCGALCAQVQLAQLFRSAAASILAAPHTGLACIMLASAHFCPQSGADHGASVVPLAPRVDRAPA